MAGLSFIYDEYKKDPGRIEKLLNEDLEISEKLDGSRFQFQLKPGNNMFFFKRNEVPITKIDRTLSKYYENAISHFENLPEEILSGVPEGWKFGMEYFPNLQPVTISYDRLPLNGLVLTDIQVKDPRGRTLEVITDKETLDKWSAILQVEAPPIIFEGKLNDSQKRKILEFLNTPYSSLIERFKTENFTRFILNLLNPSLTSSFLNNDLEKDIDGLIFKFDGKEAYRISNPEVVLTKTKKREEKPSDIYNLTLVMIQEFVMSLDLKKIKLKEKTFEERYIELISRIFNLFVQSPIYKKNFTGEVDFELPRFLTREEFRVNFGFVKDPETIALLNKNNTNRELFKIMLASLRSHKKRSSGFFTKDLLQYHNELVDKIADYINNSVKENVFFSFEEFKSVFITESNEWQEFGKDEPLTETEDLNAFPTFHEISIKNEPSLDAPMLTLRRMLSSENLEDSKKKTPVCVMMGKFQLIHNGHISAIEDANAECGMKVFLIIPRKVVGDLPEDLHREILNTVLKGNKKVHGYGFSNTRSFSELCKEFPKLDIKAFSGDETQCEDVSNQMGSEFKIVPSTQHLSTSSVVQKIRDEDYDGYKKLVPKSLHNYFYKIKNTPMIA